jgi:ABC-type uncharacterized transport system substrate-binding protein
MTESGTYKAHYPVRIGMFSSAEKKLTKTTGQKVLVFCISLFIAISSSLLLPANALAREKFDNILILLSDNEDVYLDVATTITNFTIKYCRNHKLACQNSNYDIVQVSSYDSQLHKNYRLIVTLGVHAALFAQKTIVDTKIISALIPKSNPMIKKTPKNNLQQHYLYLDQPLKHSLLLIRILSKRFKQIGALVSNNDIVSVDALNNAAINLDLELHIEQIESTDFIGTALNNLLDKIDIFLAIPDSNIHNKSTVSNILLSTYRKRIPLIGFTSAYVNAGALAAVYSSPEDIAHQVKDNIIAFFAGYPIPREQEMRNYFSILFNTDIARSLGFPIKSESKLKAQMMDHSEYVSE